MNNVNIEWEVRDGHIIARIEGSPLDIVWSIGMMLADVSKEADIPIDEVLDILKTSVDARMEEITSD